MILKEYLDNDYIQSNNNPYKNNGDFDYQQMKNDYRPGHADQTTMMKFGHRDHRGGGRSSGRETLSRVIGGYFASLIIPKVKFKAVISQIGSFKVDEPKNFLKTNSKLGLCFVYSSCISGSLKILWISKSCTIC